MLHINEIPFLFRFVRSTHLEEFELDYESISNLSNTNLLKEDLFKHEEKKGVMEDYVSFTWVSHNENPKNFFDFLSNLHEKGRKSLPKKCGLVIVDSQEALKEINSSEEIISFSCVEENCFCKNSQRTDVVGLSVDQCIHHGLFYDFKNDLVYLEVSSSLRELSSFHFLVDDDGENPPPFYRKILQIN